MTDEMNTTTGVALDVWDIVAVVIYFGLIMGVGLLVSQPFEAFHHLYGYAESHCVPPTTKTVLWLFSKGILLKQYKL